MHLAAVLLVMSLWIIYTVQAAPSRMTRPHLPHSTGPDVDPPRRGEVQKREAEQKKACDKSKTGDTCYDNCKHHLCSSTETVIKEINNEARRSPDEDNQTHIKQRARVIRAECLIGCCEPCHDNHDFYGTIAQQAASEPTTASPFPTSSVQQTTTTGTPNPTKTGSTATEVLSLVNQHSRQFEISSTTTVAAFPTTTGITAANELLLLSFGDQRSSQFGTSSTGSATTEDLSHVNQQSSQFDTSSTDMTRAASAQSTTTDRLETADLDTSTSVSVTRAVGSVSGSLHAGFGLVRNDSNVTVNRPQMEAAQTEKVKWIITGSGAFIGGLVLIALLGVFIFMRGRKRRHSTRYTRCHNPGAGGNRSTPVLPEGYQRTIPRRAEPRDTTVDRYG